MKSKVLSLECVEQTVAAWRTLGHSICLAFGSFDLVHPGHLYYLDLASEMADVVIVGVYSDEQVRRLKGPGRPIITEEQRACVVGAFESVDHAVIIEGPQYTDLIEVVGPDKILLGTEMGDHPFVLAGGSTVYRCPELLGWSTSAMIERIKARWERVSPCPIHSRN